MDKADILMILIIATVALMIHVFALRPLLKIIKEMRPLPTGKIDDLVFAMKSLYVNSYLIKSKTGYIAIDSGLSVKTAEKALRELGINPDQIKAILLTHSDSDHTGGLDCFPQTDIYLPKAEKVMIDGSTRRAIWGKNTFSKKYTALRDKEKISIDGVDILCLETPGHTKGSMSYMHNKDLFTGDLAGISDNSLSLFPSALSMNPEIQHISLERIKLQKPKRVFTAHHGMLDLG